ncbi:S41 family peptidase [Mucilaginibacter segetis]|uniref:S41 family peptidase n=1 Tax=Mucilaginibacter segetis TaxID=2793071 RepID=A0A934PRV3_9SPHI|nr:S41 family peptidase [Mucilaginibacter segetis]MBK0379638.1 S41 family peptidase [Mucilaginibacter segetis]
MKTIVLVYLCIITCGSAFAQKIYTGNEAADYVQSERDKAWVYYDKKDHSMAEIEKAIRILDNAVAFLDTPYIKEMAKTNPYLYYRRQDALRDLAGGYAMANKNDSARLTLIRMYNANATSNAARILLTDTIFTTVRDEPWFRDIVTKLQNKGNMWNYKALNTPYQASLPEAEKLAGLALLWTQARYNFVNFDRLDKDWNQTYLDFIPKVQNTKTTAEYYRVLMNFYAQLKDGHTNVYVPDSLAAEFYSRPPFRTELIEGRVFVTQVMSDSLLKTGITPGLEVLKIDGQPVISYAEQNVKPYQSSSTPQDMEVREFTYGLLSGPKNKPIAFQFKDQKGNIIDRIVPRTGYHDVKGLKTMEYKTINNIGYLTINNFEDNSIIKQFDSLYTAEISKTKGLIIDIRYNGGGSGNIGFNIISRLTDKPFKISASKTLKYVSKPNAEPFWEDNGPGIWNANGKIYYDKPVIVLIGPRTFSAAEDFTVAFDFMKRGRLVGMATGGSTGQPVPFDLPGGGSARVCGKHDSYPDGKEFVGIGIMPDIVVKKTIKDLRNGRDAAKETALKLLN